MLMNLFTMFYQNVVKLKRGDFVSFEKEKRRLDDFCFKKIEVSKYKNLESMLKLVLVLSRDQASVETTFSLNIIYNFNMKEIFISRS